LYIATDIKGPYCFNFTWPGIDKNMKDCDDPDEYEFTPCIEPIYSKCVTFVFIS